MLRNVLENLLECLLFESQIAEGVESLAGCFWPMKHSQFVEALANGRLRVSGSFDPDIDIANVLI